jgi:hypothetical protein
MVVDSKKLEPIPVVVIKRCFEGRGGGLECHE